MHFATFAGSDIEAIEPLVELETARREQHVGDWADEGGFGTIHVGETAIVPLRTG
jgi:N-acyl-phosphatidylethanolamine-hydrolysing phospholipase D